MFHWQFSTKKERPQSWYIIALLVVGFLIIYGIWEEIYLLSVVTFLFSGVYLLIENNSTPLVTVDITEHGINISSVFYEYSQISSFALIYEGQVARVLRIGVKKGLTSTIDIPFAFDLNAREVREYLLSFIPEDTEAQFTKSDRVIQAMGL
jgi:hypothetical protein